MKKEKEYFNVILGKFWENVGEMQEKCGEVSRDSKKFLSNFWVLSNFWWNLDIFGYLPKFL